jgi:hypothetical protein
MLTMSNAQPKTLQRLHAFFSQRVRDRYSLSTTQALMLIWYIEHARPDGYVFGSNQTIAEEVGGFTADWSSTDRAAWASADRAIRRARMELSKLGLIEILNNRGGYRGGKGLSTAVRVVIPGVDRDVEAGGLAEPSSDSTGGLAEPSSTDLFGYPPGLTNSDNRQEGCTNPHRRVAPTRTGGLAQPVQPLYYNPSLNPSSGAPAAQAPAARHENGEEGGGLAKPALKTTRRPRWKTAPKWTAGFRALVDAFPVELQRDLDGCFELWQREALDREAAAIATAALVLKFGDWEQRPDSAPTPFKFLKSKPWRKPAAERQSA